MELSELVQFLTSRLNYSLPGEPAHDQMKPRLENGQPISIKHEQAAREGGVLILFYEQSGQIRFPLIQRPEYDGIHSGQIALPGGKKEPSDEDLIDTALREAEEEIGVSRANVNVIGTLSKFYVAASNYDVLPVIGYSNKVPNFHPDPREVSDIITPITNELVDDTNLGVKEMVVRNGFKLHSPFYSLEDRIVWGATAMMLSELRSILKEYTVL